MLNAEIEGIVRRLIARGIRLDNWRFRPMNESDDYSVIDIPEFEEIDIPEEVECGPAEDDVEFLREIVEAGGEVERIVAFHFRPGENTADTIRFDGRLRYAA